MRPGAPVTDAPPNREAGGATSDGLAGGSLDVKIAPPDVRDPFVLGYRLGYAAGFDVGYRRAEDDTARDWHELFLHVRRELAQPTFAELKRRRQPSDEPCGVRTCRGCSRCVRAEAVRRGAVRS